MEQLVWDDMLGIVEITAGQVRFVSFDEFLTAANAAHTTDGSRAFRDMLCKAEPQIDPAPPTICSRFMVPVVNKLKGFGDDITPDDIADALAEIGLGSRVASMRAMLWSLVVVKFERWVNPAIYGTPAMHVMKNMSSVRAHGCWLSGVHALSGNPCTMHRPHNRTNKCSWSSSWMWTSGRRWASPARRTPTTCCGPSCWCSTRTRCAL